jgi:hypothetical protein
MKRKTMISSDNPCQAFYAALGVPMDRCTGVDVHFRPNQLVTVEVTYVMTEEQLGEFTEVVEKYRLVRDE